MIIVIIFLLTILIGVLLLRSKRQIKKPIIILFAIILIVEIGYMIYQFTTQDVSDGWVMKITVTGFNEGYDNTVYVYNNRKVVIDPADESKKTESYNLEKNIRVKGVVEYVEGYEEEKETSRSYYFDTNSTGPVTSEIFDSDEVGYYYQIELKDGTTKCITPQNEILQEFFSQIPFQKFETSLLAE